MITPPHILLLEAAKTTLEAVDWVTETGENVTVRHFRQRYSTTSEKPCIALRWTGTSNQNVRGDMLSNAEKAKVLGLDLVIDADIATEDSDADPTGWLVHSRIAGVALAALQDQEAPTNALYPALSDWVAGDDEHPDPDSKPDDGRLVKPVSVVYRVRSDDENVILAQGVNAT